MTEYTAIRVSTLRGDLKIPFNAFVKVAGKYILFCREGESFEGGRLDRLKSKKLQKMYIPIDQLNAYKGYMNENLEKAYSQAAGKSIEIRAQIVHGALQASAEDLIEDPKSQAFYSVTIEAARRFQNFVHSEPESLKPMLAIDNKDFNISHHGVVVAALSLAIADELKFTETRPMQMDTLVVGCMLHDLEHHYNNINLSVSPDKLTNVEHDIFLQHSEHGFERVKGEPYYDSLVFDIIRHHEELIDGSGPLRMREKDLDPLVLVAAAANAFDHLITYEQLLPKDALKKLLIEKMGLLSLDCMKGLQSALKKRGIV